MTKFVNIGGPTPSKWVFPVDEEANELVEKYQRLKAEFDKEPPFTLWERVKILFTTGEWVSP